MGRGRQKAKHTKVARELKYFSPSTDLTALERELGASNAEHEEELIDKWADLYADDEDEESAEDVDDEDRRA
ncbi:MAG: hypothetical protein RI933_580 [Actinomycetota bacterium]|uniref:DUF3073 domain-containing protein n=1 Tax=Candidatus Rhodoluna planktonica TaxID=535712 RepID=A0A1D9DXM1_9MICO|nr:DUF3073 domain-containing protein [Candidatus Rhodoluna planktonica]AOY55552.1 hypothetical protein A4Z71_00580 [Candidatus Rhodoluna planktonica]